MRYAIAIAILLGIAIGMIVLSGCAMNYDSQMNTVPGLVPRAIQRNVFLGGVDTGIPKSGGIPISDADVGTLDADYDSTARAIIAMYNGASNAEALTMLGLGTAATGAALGHAPVAAVGGLALAGVALSRGFTMANIPAHANAYSDFLGDLNIARKAYRATRALEVCGTDALMPGNRLTVAGATWAGLLDDARGALDLQLKNLRPTQDQINNLANASQIAQKKMAATTTECPPSPTTAPPANSGVSDQPLPLPQYPYQKTPTEKLTAKKMNQLSLQQFPK